MPDKRITQLAAIGSGSVGEESSFPIVVTNASIITNRIYAEDFAIYVSNQISGSFVTNASLATTLSSYVTNVSLSSTLSNYVTSFSLLSTLSAYVLNTTLTGTLANYVLTTTLNSTLTNYVNLAGSQSITGQKTFSDARTKFQHTLAISPSASGGGAPVNWNLRINNLANTNVLDTGINSAGASWMQNYSSLDDQVFGVIALNPQGGDVVVNRISSAGFKFDVNGTLRSANSAYFATTAGGAVGIGLTTIDASAQLHMSATNKGALLPRLTTTQINAIGTPANGLLLYNTTINHLCCYQTGTGWVRFSHSPM